MQRKGMQSSFPKSTSDLHKMTEVRGVPSGSAGWAVGDNLTRRGQERSRQNRSRSTEARHQAAAGRPRSMFNPLSGRGDRGERGERKQNMSTEGGDVRSPSRPWYQQERGGGQVQVNNGRTDSGIGEELWRSSKHQHSDKTSSNKSSFGMILKDRFQKNPNMYFPDTSVTSVPSESGWCQISPGLRGKPGLKREVEDWSDTDTLVHNMSEGSFDKVSIF